MFLTSESRRAANLTGALAVALTDELREEMNSDSAALVTLSERSGLTVEFLSGVIGLSHSATVRLIDRLSGHGLLERGPGPDARSISVRLTPRGRRRAARLRLRREEVLTNALTSLNERERRQISRLVDKLLAGMTGSRSQARFTCRVCDHGVCQAEIGCPVDRAATGLGQ